MYILDLEWRNIFSYGNELQRIDLGETGKLWQLYGKSGAGKSAIMSLPKLLFFGRVDTGKKGDIANRINKNGYLKGTVLKGKDTYVIERTFSPDSLSLYKNGVEIDKAGKKNMEEIINQEIMEGLPYHIFSNVINLSLKNFKSFISMTPNDKRLIIDKIFSLEIINVIHEMIAKDIREVGNMININNSQIFTIEQNIKQSELELKRLEEKKDEDSKLKIEELKTKYNSIQEQLGINNNNYTIYYNKYTELNNARNSIVTLRQQKQHELSDTDRMIALYKEDKCPTCGTPFVGYNFDELRNQLDTRRAEIVDTINSYDSNIATYDRLIIQVNSGITTITNNINSLQKLNAAVVTQINSISQHVNSKDEHDAIQNIIDVAKHNRGEMLQIVSDNTQNLEYLNILEDLYGSDGIKRDMMQNYLPTLNEEIQDALSSLSFPYSLEFDNNFDPHFEDLGQEINPETLSEGERKRADVIVICALIKMLKRKYPQLNMIALDETLGSLDVETSCDLLKYLNEIAEDLNINVFIVSHATLDESLFDKRIHIFKNSGFSTMEYMN